MLKRNVRESGRNLTYTLEPGGQNGFKFTVTMETGDGAGHLERAEAFAAIAPADAIHILGKLAEGGVEPCCLPYVLDDCLIETMYRPPDERLISAISTARRCYEGDSSNLDSRIFSD